MFLSPFFFTRTMFCNERHDVRVFIGGFGLYIFFAYLDVFVWGEDQVPIPVPSFFFGFFFCIMDVFDDQMDFSEYGECSKEKGGILSFLF